MSAARAEERLDVLQFAGLGSSSSSAQQQQQQQRQLSGVCLLKAARRL
jgi:hypothetical protein